MHRVACHRHGEHGMPPNIDLRSSGSVAIEQNGVHMMYHALSVHLSLLANLSSLPLNAWIQTQEDTTKSWKKLVNIAVSGAAGMISNHLLFKVSSL